MDLWWSRPVVAGIMDGLVPNLLVAAVTGSCAVAAVLWLAKKRWEPALHHLTTVVDREMQGAERAAQALQGHVHAQAQRGHRQAASVHGAIAGVRALHNLTEELDQCATDLNHLAQLLAQDAQRQSAPGIARHVVSSAKQLAQTAEHARITYRRLHSSVNQLLAESMGDEAEGEELVQHARDLTGAMQRLRDDLHAGKGAARRPRDPHVDPAPPRSRAPEDARDRPRPAPPPRPDVRDMPLYDEGHPRERDRDYDQGDDLPPPGDYRERRRDDAPPRRRAAPRPPDEDDREEAGAGRGRGGPTHRRDRPAEFAPRRLPDLDDRHPRRDDGSGWLSDHYPQMPARRDGHHDTRRRS